MGRRLFVLNDCARECPNVVKTHTEGSGYGQDYTCKKTQKLISGYVEWDRDLPKLGTFPKWCPLFEAEDGMYEGVTK